MDDHCRKITITRRARKRPAGYEFKEEPQVVKFVQAQPSEYLGTKTIEGLVCEGYRTQTTLENPSVLGMSSSTPLVFKIETWMSDLSVYPMLMVSENPLQGKVVSRMVEVQEGVEPNPKIFELPQGYRMEESELANSILQQ